MRPLHRPGGVAASSAALLFLLFIPVLLSAPVEAAEKGPAQDQSKTLVLDGSFVHDVGQLRMNITNFGLLGSQPESSAPYSEAPSAEWPAGSGVEHLFGAGLWVGAWVDGVQLVSTGQNASEFMSDPEDPVDILYSQRPGEAGSARLPDRHADDDHDGLEDEDPINGLDDDGDGLIDEDAAGIGRQHFRCQMRDDQPLAVELYPDHNPLGISIVQESFQWSEDEADDFVGMRYQITNDGDLMLERVELGIFMDPDVGVRGTQGLAEDDLVDFYKWYIIDSEDDGGSVWPINIAYGFDADGDGGAAPSYLGVMIIGQAAKGVNPIPSLEMRGMRAFRGDMAANRGGDPTNDFERYRLLAQKTVDPGATEPADWRVVVSGNTLERLAPGETVVLDLAFVAGASQMDLLRNAAQAARTHYGQWVDRDGDPETGQDGKEYRVHWYRGPGEVWGELSAQAHRGRLQLRVEASFGDGELSVVRLARKNLPEWIWALYPDPAKATFFALLRDEDRGPWPREYELRLDDLVLDELFVKNPGQGRGLTLNAHPLPFNPRVTLSYALATDSNVSLRILDARGRTVRRLALSVQSAGEHQIIWDGTDDAGASLASGVYHALITGGGESATRRLVLVR